MEAPARRLHLQLHGLRLEVFIDLGRYGKVKRAEGLRLQRGLGFLEGRPPNGAIP